MIELTESQRDLLSGLRNTAGRFCAFIDYPPEGEQLGYSRLLHGLLAELYFRAQLLPLFDPWEDEADEEETDEERQMAEDLAARVADLRAGRWRTDDPQAHRSLSFYWQVEGQVKDKVGRYNRYAMVFDPFDNAPEPNAHFASVSDCVADIYADVRSNLEDDETSGQPEPERYWHWRYDFWSNWGRHHLVPAMRALAEAIYRIEEELEDDPGDVV